METKFIKLVLMIMFLGCKTFVFAQNNYCYNQAGENISFPIKRTDSLYIECTKNNGSAIIRIINPTRDTLYLFRSYFNKELQPSKYLHQVDQKNRIYYISFIPLVSNLSTKTSDKIILGEASVAHKGQVLYDFVKLNPNSYYSLQIAYSELFKNYKDNQNAIKKYNIHSLNKFNEASFKTITTSKLTGKYNLVFQFAVYKDVSILCREADYYLNEFEFNKQAKSFKIVYLPIKLNDSYYTLFR